jgi:hypothetical protein
MNYDYCADLLEYLTLKAFSTSMQCYTMETLDTEDKIILVFLAIGLIAMVLMAYFVHHHSKKSETEEK